MTYREPLSQISVAVAVSESQNLLARGLSPEHLRDALAEIARHLLAMGARIVFGGDLRQGGFTELLFELVARHRRDADAGDHRVGVINVLAWPVYTSWPTVELEALQEELEGMVELQLLDRCGNARTVVQHAQIAPEALSHADWADGLSAMRRVVTDRSDARVVLGGQTDRFKGRMPGIAEEAHCAFERGQPIYLLGGFGGCASDIAAQLGLGSTVSGALDWQGCEFFIGKGPEDLRNGLSTTENMTLAKTVHVDEAVGLILRGLLRLGRQRADGPLGAGGSR